MTFTINELVNILVVSTVFGFGCTAGVSAFVVLVDSVQGIYDKIKEAIKNE